MWHYCKHALSVVVLGLSISYPVTAETVFVGVRAHSGAEQAAKQWGPTIDYLSESVPGYSFVLLPYPRLDEQIADAGKGKFDFVLTNPSAFVEMAHRYHARALLTLINKRQGTPQTRFGSVIFVRADAEGILTLADVKGKRLKAVSPLGFGGWRAAWLELLHNGIDPQTDLAQLSFASGNQPRVIKAIQEKEADVGVVRTDMLERLHQQKIIDLREFRIIHNVETDGFPFFHSTPLYPEWPFAVMQGTDEKLTERVVQAMLELSEAHPAARQGNYVGWTPALDYSPVDALLEELRIGPYQGDAGVAGLSATRAPVIALLILVFLGFLGWLGFNKARQSPQ